MLESFTDLPYLRYGETSVTLNIHPKNFIFTKKLYLFFKHYRENVRVAIKKAECRLLVFHLPHNEDTRFLATIQE
jgi:hypothetical protein